MRLGLVVPEPSGPDVLGSLCGQVEQAAADGFASVWANHVFGMDALTALAVAGSRVPGIELGTAVVPSYPRHPVALAQQALTVASIVGPRLALGIGLSHKIVVEEVFGHDFSRPLQHMREYLTILLPLLEGQSVSFRGRTMRSRATLTPATQVPVPVLLAALGPGMLRLAAEEADGTVLWMAGLGTVRDHVLPALRAARPAGEPPARVVCILPVCVTDDPARAHGQAAKAYSAYGSLPSYRALLDREGAAGPADVAIIGDEDAVAARILEFGKTGVSDFVAAEYGTGADRARTRVLLRSLCGARC
jgi:F420-dependent oxidoreductase-like protein